jgi:hypothetical protein
VTATSRTAAKLMLLIDRQSGRRQRAPLARHVRGS